MTNDLRHYQEQLRICKAYVRWKWRQRILLILKVWRHQALYGRVDGLYSRYVCYIGYNIYYLLYSI
jgi:hypothetical protein